MRTPLKNLPDITFIVTAHYKPNQLKLTILSLLQQKGAKVEILVSNNTKDLKMRKAISEVCTELHVRCIVNDAPECYSAINKIYPEARGRFLCFPSEEDYYCPEFSRKLLQHAKRFRLQLVYCDCLYDSRYIGSYEVMRVQPIIGHIDKGGFLLNRFLFEGFTDAPDKEIPTFCDGYLIEKLRAQQISFGKIPEVLWVHN